MDVKLVHESHQMEASEYGSDDHCDVICTVCDMSHCYLCPDGQGLDDDELKEPCMGFSQFDAVWDGDRLVGRKSKTGWF